MIIGEIQVVQRWHSTHGSIGPMETPIEIEMDENGGYRYFRKPPYKKVTKQFKNGVLASQRPAGQRRCAAIGDKIAQRWPISVEEAKVLFEQETYACYSKIMVSNIHRP